MVYCQGSHPFLYLDANGIRSKQVQYTVTITSPIGAHFFGTHIKINRAHIDVGLVKEFSNSRAKLGFPIMTAFS